MFLQKIIRYALAPLRFGARMGVSAVGLGRFVVFDISRWEKVLIVSLCLAVYAVFRIADLLSGYLAFSATQFVGIIAVSLVLMVPFVLHGTKPSTWGWIGSFWFVASYLISNTWQIAFYVLDPLPAEVAEAVRQIMEGVPPSGYGFALRIDQSNKRLLVAIVTFIVFFARPQDDLQARFTFMITGIAETFAWLSHLECKFLRDPLGSTDLHIATIWGVEVSRYACGRALASWAPHVEAAIPALYLIYSNSRKKFRGV